MLNQEQRVRLAKLPKWAREQFARLEGKLLEMDGQVQRLTEGAPADSNATVNPYSDRPTALDRNPTVRFRMEDGGYLEARWDGLTLIVQGSGRTLRDEFVVRPTVSNSVRINFADEKPRG